MSLSTHVLDSTVGRPKVGVPVRLEYHGVIVASGQTDADGRIKDLPTAQPGVYRLTFDVAGEFYPEVVVTFRVTDPRAHHHVPLLLSPFAYSTYRGS